MSKNRSQLIDSTGGAKSTDKIGRRVFLEGTAGLIVAAGVMAGGLQKARAAQKAEQADVEYQDSPNDGHKCADCKFYNGDGTCQVVAGAISPDGWCTAWSEA